MGTLKYGHSKAWALQEMGRCVMGTVNNGQIWHGHYKKWADRTLAALTAWACPGTGHYVKKIQYTPFGGLGRGHIQKY